jgi:hypothetical protein
MELSDNIGYHGLPIPDAERQWLAIIYEGITANTITSDILRLALELAWKRGYAQGAR